MDDSEETKTIAVSNIFFALLCGVFFFLSFPKYGWGLIAWIAFVPLFFALRNVDTLLRAMLLGWIAGVVSFIGIFYWIVWVLVNYGYLPLYLSLMIMLLLVFYLSIYFALFAAGIVYFRKKVPLFIIAPVLWVCLEYVKSKLFTGVPWENLGHSQINNFYFIQLADITGVFGLSFLVMLLNVAIFEIIKKKSGKSFALAAAIFILWSCVYVYGILRVNDIDQAVKNSPAKEVFLIQGNIDQAIKWKESFQNETFRIHEELSLRSLENKGGLIVWPETAVTANFQDENNVRRRIREMSVKTGNWFLFGSISYKAGEGKKDYFNSAYLISPEGIVSGRYDKVHLVPYGEYVPMKTIFPFVRSLAAGIGDFTEGKGWVPLQSDLGKIGVMICYEGIFPEAGRAYKKAGTELLVNITNDAWFGSTSAPYQHLSMSIFRAVETRMFFVRAANTGISAIVDPTGKIIVQSRLSEKDSIHGRVQLIQMASFYAKYGDWLAVTCFIILTIIFLSCNIRRKRNDYRKHSGNYSGTEKKNPVYR